MEVNLVCATIIIFFFFNDTATTEIYTLSLHDALPIFPGEKINYAVNVTDKEDGSLANGRIRPSEVAVTIDYLSEDRKSTRLNSSHANISYAVFCLKKKTNTAL